MRRLGEPRFSRPLLRRAVAQAFLLRPLSLAVLPRVLALHRDARVRPGRVSAGWIIETRRSVRRAREPRRDQKPRPGGSPPAETLAPRDPTLRERTRPLRRWENSGSRAGPAVAMELTPTAWRPWRRKPIDRLLLHAGPRCRSTSGSPANGRRTTPTTWPARRSWPPSCSWSSIRWSACPRRSPREAGSGRLMCAAMILIVCVLIPRGFCGYLCPLGTLIDLFDWAIGKRVTGFRDRRRRLVGAHQVLAARRHPGIAALFGVLVSGPGRRHSGDHARTAVHRRTAPDRVPAGLAAWSRR